MSLLLISGQTDIGRRRTDNQDTFISKAIWSETSVLLSVIDGVGGYAGGDRAAAIARESIEKYMASPNGDPLSMLREAVVFANNQIHAVRQKELLLSQMGCVLTTALADCRAGKVAFVHVGDTRLYRYRQGILEKLTRDHSLVGAREDANELTEAEAMSHPRRNEILRDVGTNKHRVDDPHFLESDETDFLPGDVLLLCSDGLTDMITRAQIKDILDKPISLDEQTAELIRLANDQGGKDNITVVLAKNNESPEHFQERMGQPDNVTSFSNKYSVENDTLPTQRKPVKKQTQTWLLLGISFLVIVGGIIWYQKQQFRQLNNLQHTTSDSGHVTLVSDPPISQLDSLIRVANHDKDHRLVLAVDTFRLTKPLLMTDSLQELISNSNRPTVLIPADTALVPVALRILRKGPVRLENIILSGFKTGIETSSDLKLHLKNVHFNHVDLPVYVAMPPDTIRNSIIEISVRHQTDTVKNNTSLMATIRFDTRFPGYEVLSELGRSNARVLKARHLATGDLVAIKHFALNTDAETLRRFQRESELMIRINHPNIVKIREVQLEAELPYIVMELIEGGTLKDRIVNQGQIDIPTLIRIGLQMASAFSVIHSQGIVHRDVKPENILYRPLSSGELHFLLTDFGVARLHEQSHTLTGQSLMTYEYAAPEQFNNPKLVNVATDYYSLGVVLYEGLYGYVPFALNDEAGIATFMNRVLTETPAQLIESASNTEQGVFAELLQKLLQKNPAERLSDPDELIWLLKQAELAYLQARRGGTIRSSKPPIPPKQQIPNEPEVVNVASGNSDVEEENTRNATLGSWGWILLLAALLIGGGVYYVMNRSEKPVRIPAVDQTDTQSDAIDTLNSEADSSDVEAALRQQQEEEAQRHEQQRQQALAAVDSLNVKVTDYHVGLLGGIKNVQLQLLNPSQFVFASVVVQVDYYKENGDLYKSEKVYFSPVEARSSLLKEAPNSDRGTRLTCQIISHQFEPVIDSLLAVPSDSVNY